LAERSMPHPAEPVTFVRSGRTVIGPGAPILIPPDVGNVGYEAELAVVIGKTALRVSREQAMLHVAGYTVHNDVSGSGLIKQDGGNFVRGKNLPASSPLGPWLATPDELPNPYDVAIRLDIDGRLLQNGSTATMLFNIADLISYISHRMPLEPGDVVATGTPAGVAAMHQPPAWLTPGATVSIELEGLGRLSNPIHAGAPFLED
jgi:2,4-diketo-3-deoxy-L-fuconate hydrolase